MFRSVILSAGSSCFVACPGCYNHFSKTLASTATLTRFIQQLHQSGLPKVTVGGGDPLTRPDIISLLRELRIIGLRINLDTVGTAFLRSAPIRFMGRGHVELIDPSRVAPLVDIIGIPLDGSTDEIFRQFRRFSSVSDQQQILFKLDEVRASVCINTVVHARNIQDLPEIASIISSHPCVKEWQLFQFMPIGPLGHHNRERFKIENNAFLEAVGVLRDELSTRLKITAKSTSARKNRYLLIDGAGLAWIPKQNPMPSWTDSDTNEERIVIGAIDDPRTLESILRLP